MENKIAEALLLVLQELEQERTRARDAQLPARPLGSPYELSNHLDDVISHAGRIRQIARAAKILNRL